jgi:hypothetical protein
MLVQCFLQYPNLDSLVGVEFSSMRYSVSLEGMKKLANYLANEDRNQSVTVNSSEKHYKLTLVDKYSKASRAIEIRFGDLFECSDYSAADIIIAETDISSARASEFLRMLSKAKKGVKLLTYNSLENLLEAANSSAAVSTNKLAENKEIAHFERLESNRSCADVFPSSWGSPHFHCYRKLD